MTTDKRNGACGRIVDFVAANPGCTAPQIEAAFSIGERNGLLVYCVKAGKLFKSGRRRFFRYYASEALAIANDAKHRAEAEASITHGKARIDRQAQLRRRAKRHEAGAPVINTRPSDGIVRLEPDVRLAGNVKVTVAPTPLERFAVTAPEKFFAAGKWLTPSPWAAAVAGGAR